MTRIHPTDDLQLFIENTFACRLALQLTTTEHVTNTQAIFVPCRLSIFMRYNIVFDLHATHSDSLFFNFVLFVFAASIFFCCLPRAELQPKNFEKCHYFLFIYFLLIFFPMLFWLFGGSYFSIFERVLELQTFLDTVYHSSVMIFSTFLQNVAISWVFICSLVVHSS